MKTPKSILIVGRRWFRKGPGTTYHSATAYVDGEVKARIDYAYGYDRQYEHNAFNSLAKLGIVSPEETEPPWVYCERNGITYNTTVADVARKSDL